MHTLMVMCVPYALKQYVTKRKLDKLWMPWIELAESAHMMAFYLLNSNYFRISDRLLGLRYVCVFCINQ